MIRAKIRVRRYYGLEPMFRRWVVLIPKTRRSRLHKTHVILWSAAYFPTWREAMAHAVSLVSKLAASANP